MLELVECLIVNTTPKGKSANDPFWENSERLLYWTTKSYGSGTNGFGKAGTLFVAFDEVYYGVYPILDGEEAAAWYSYGARCYGAAVRCVKVSNR